MCDPLRPDLAVIIPTFDRADVLGRAIDSVLVQDVDGYELIVVDDGSSDETADVLESYSDPRLRIVAQDNQGVCAARNAGVATSEAPFLVFLDSDDEAAPGWLRFYRDASAGGIRFASCGVRIVAERETILTPKQSGPEFGYLRARFLAGAFGLHRKLLEAAGGFRKGLRYSEHTDLALRLGAVMLDDPFPSLQTDEPLLITYPSPRSYDARLRYESAMTILRDDAVHLARSPHLHATYAAVAGVAASKLGRRREARSLLAEAIRRNPRALRNYARLVRVSLT